MSDDATSAQSPGKPPKLKYALLVKWARISSSYSYKTKSLGDTVQAFMNNIDRIRSLSLTPAVVTAHALRVKLQEKGVPADGNDLIRGAEQVQSYIEAIPAVKDGIYSLCASVVTGAWTAFESLATDLWIHSVNIRPKSLGAKALRAPRRRKAGEVAEGTEDLQLGDATKVHSVSVDMLVKYDFDLKDRLGYFLWRERRFDFNSLATLRHAYHVVFPEGKAWFEDKLFADLPALEATRQVVVHRGGHVDDFFVDRMRRHAVLSKLKPGDRIPLDGVVASQSAEVALACGLLLLDRVDDWLDANPE